MRNYSVQSELTRLPLGEGGRTPDEGEARSTMQYDSSLSLTASRAIQTSPRPAAPCALPAHNPFATRFTRPGAMEYLWPDGQSAAALVERLAKSRWRGTILGPHGVGKSTLLEVLMPALAAAGRRLVRFELHDGSRRLPRGVADWRDVDERTLLIVDGYEQLSRPARVMLLARVRLRGSGLLVTSHTPTALPLLIELKGELPTVQRLVTRLLTAHPSTVSAEDITRLFHEQRGNVRETLFGLYDLHESQRRANGNESGMARDDQE